MVEIGRIQLVTRGVILLGKNCLDQYHVVGCVLRVGLWFEWRGVFFFFVCVGSKIIS